MTKNTIEGEAGAGPLSEVGRRDYAASVLLESDLAPDPFGQFDRWFAEARHSGIVEPNAMILATADAAGAPSVRAVLLKHVDVNGFVFFTNMQSRKGRELGANPRAALLFYWSELERQIRIEGPVAPVSSDESDRYFASRPRGAQIGAHASAQSELIGSRRELEARAAEFEQRFSGAPVPRPTVWGGYRVNPLVVEFWQGRPDRLHDRCVYRREAAGWSISRLQP